MNTEYKNLNYSFIHTEKDNKITLFIDADKKWLRYDVDFTLSENTLYVQVNEDIFKIDNLPLLLNDSLANSTTLVALISEDHVIGEVQLPPLANNLIKKQKP